MSLLNTITQTVKVRSSTISGLFRFLIQRKMWWLVPMILLLLVGFVIILVAQSTPVGPFIYTLF